jgi:hypothetical protein
MFVSPVCCDFLTKKAVLQRTLSVDFVMCIEMSAFVPTYGGTFDSNTDMTDCCSVAKNQHIDVLIQDDQESDMELAVHFGIGHSAMQEIIFAVGCWKVYCCQIPHLLR